MSLGFSITDLGQQSLAFQIVVWHSKLSGRCHLNYQITWSLNTMLSIPKNTKPLYPSVSNLFVEHASNVYCYFPSKLARYDWGKSQTQLSKDTVTCTVSEILPRDCRSPFCKLARTGRCERVTDPLLMVHVSLVLGNEN